jgi:hypothetical protein
MKWEMPVLLLIFFLVFSVSVGALAEVPGWDTECHNTTHLNKTADIDLNGTLYDFSQDTVRCPYGCDTGRNICRKWPEGAIPGEYYMLFEIIALAILFIGIYRLDINERDVKIFDVVISLFAVILFSILALQGNNVIDTSTGEAMQVILVVYLNMGFALFSLIPFFWFLFKFVRSVVEQ